MSSSGYKRFFVMLTSPERKRKSAETQPLSATDLCASRTEGAGRAWEDPGGPVTGRDWSTGCSAEEGSLEGHRTHTSLCLIRLYTHTGRLDFCFDSAMQTWQGGVFNHSTANKHQVDHVTRTNRDHHYWNVVLLSSKFPLFVECIHVPYSHGSLNTQYH